MAVSEDDGIGWRCYRQHEGKGRRHGSRCHQIQRVDLDIQRLFWENESKNPETNGLLSVARLSGHPLVSCKNVAYSQN